MFDIHNLTIAQARKALDEKRVTACELVAAYRVHAQEKNDEIHAYLEIFDDSHEQAERADAMIANGTAHPLTGIPIVIKDNILIHGHIASGASKILEKYVATYDAHVITKLKEAGAVILGRSNMDEFAMGSSTENSAFGVTKNPHDTTRIPGGSSGGSAAAVAADMALVGLGTDTGGSIRQPAALCGLVGYKPTYGAVSRYGAMAMGSSLDQIGPLAKTVADAEVLFDAISGHDEHDATSLPETLLKPAKTVKTIGVPREFLQEGIDADVRESFEKTLDEFSKNGYKIVDIALPHAVYALAVYYIVMPAEVSTNLARYDGVRYGTHVTGKDLVDDYAQTRGEGFGAEVRRRMLLGTFVLSSGYADAYYRKAIAVREEIRNDFTHAFNEVDIIATPTTPTPAFKIGEKAHDPVAMYTADIFTVPANLAGVPALSLPMGTVSRESKDLPVGIQFIAPNNHDKTLFKFGAHAESIISAKE